MTEIFNIERFATHDGPGIRTVVFFKGCGMHCPWCANPESWSRRPVLMHDQLKCTGCGQCAAVCPVQAINLKDCWSVDQSRCTACRQCETVCLNDAISFAGTAMTSAAIMHEVMKDIDYYRQSNGGITISGGEPFRQKNGLIELLQLAKANGLHTAVETAGFYSTEALLEAMPWIDLFLFDQKHVNQQTLLKVTGADMPMIDANLKLLGQHCPERTVIRIPVIPGFNCGQNTIPQILDKIKSFGFTRADLLPYHTMAVAKWAQMNKEYPYDGHPQLPKEELKQMMEYGSRLGLDVRIGG